ncbi:hypothetical protein F5144DRAFT_607435 [Chaetomium tenue]|uniref:Uncharacterized protein n=1 Tax=Chaetomium tenue TaxID=1854479 RepID=A0ACB7PMK7_9PEZI|nr:hypothetical protein F5144DRAFT_607435 [Chaetomium globosum]
MAILVVLCLHIACILIESWLLQLGAITHLGRLWSAGVLACPSNVPTKQAGSNSIIDTATEITGTEFDPFAVTNVIKSGILEPSSEKRIRLKERLKRAVKEFSNAGTISTSGVPGAAKILAATLCSPKDKSDVTSQPASQSTESYGNLCTAGDTEETARTMVQHDEDCSDEKKIVHLELRSLAAKLDRLAAGVNDAGAREQSSASDKE